MSINLETQLDYIIFTGSLAYLASAIGLLALYLRKENNVPWQWLCLASVALWSHQWLNIISKAGLAHNPVSVYADYTLFYAAVLCVYEFGVRTGVRATKRPHARVVMFAFSSLVFVSLWAESFVYAVFFLLSVCLIAVFLAIRGISRHIISSDRSLRMPFILIATGLTGSLLTGLACVTCHAVHFGPICFAVGKITVPVLHLLMAFCAMVFVVGVSSHFRRVRFLQYKRLVLGNMTVAAIIASAVIIVGGYFLTNSFGNSASEQIRKDSQNVAKEVSERIKNDWQRASAAVKAMSSAPQLADVLEDKNSITVHRANTVLDRFNSAYSSSICYLMDNGGTVIASSNRDEEASLVGRNYKFRPYFIEGMKNGSGRYLALGVTTNRRGHYVSHSINDSQGQVLGLVVMKMAANNIMAKKSLQEIVLLVDPNNIVFMSSKPELLFTSLDSLSEVDRDEIALSRRYANREIEKADKFTIKGDTALIGEESYLIARSSIESDGWSVVVLTSRASALINRLVGMLVTLFIFILTGAFLSYFGATLQSKYLIAENETKMRNLADGSPYFVALIDREGMFVTINAYAQQVLGCDNDVLSGSDFLHIWSTGNRDQLVEAVHGVTKGDQQKLLVGMSGENLMDRMWQLTLNPLYKNTGEVDGFVAVAIDITQTIEAEKAISHNLDFLETVINTVPVPVFLKNRDGMYLNCNKAFANFFGRESEDILGLDILDIIDVKNADIHIREEERVLATREVSRYESQMPRGDGEMRDMLISKAAFMDADGEVQGTIGSMVDITEQKNIERALAESEHRLTELIDASPLGAISFDLDSHGELTICHANNQSSNILGVDCTKLTGTSVKAAFPGLDDMVVQTLVKTAATGQRFETNGFEYNDGRVSGTFELTAIQTGINRGSVFFRDITEKKRAEEALKESEERLQAIFDSAQTGIVLIDPSTGLVTDANPAALTIIDGTREDVVGTDQKLFFQIDDIGSAGRAVEKLTSESQVKKLSGETTSVVQTIVPVKIKGRDLMLASFTDISDLKEAESVLHIQNSAINAAADQIIISDSEGKIIFVNEAFVEETGLKSEYIIGQSIGILKSVYTETNFIDRLKNTIRLGTTWQGEITSRYANGKFSIEDVTITPVKNAEDVVEHFIAIKRNITEKKNYEEKLDHLAHHDSLTGLPNRLLFSNCLNMRIAQARRLKNRLAVMFIDLDRFKIINDTLGHNLGDSMILSVAKRLQSSIGENDILARMGGDEFTVILTDIESANDALECASRIQESLTQSVEIAGRDVYTTVSMGISIYPDHGTDVETLVKNADAAMFKAKEQGRNQSHLFSEGQNTGYFEKMTLESDLRKALARDEFVVYYQPRVDIVSGKIMGAEALVRWEHPEYGLVSPNDFIPIAEETGLIVNLGESVLEKAVRQNKAWQDEDLPKIDIAVNLSARQLQQRDIVPSICRIIDSSGLSPEYLDLEITEGTLMHNPEAATKILRNLKSMGMKISIDDFGTGYSSLAYLKRFPINAVKIDRCFVSDITANPDDAAIAGAVVAMAHSLKLKVIAEGVETLEQLEFLRSLQCDEMQGYFVSKPVPAEEFRLLLKQFADDDWDREGFLNAA